MTEVRIDQLHLIAYGAFTDHLLNLAAPGLHLVYGPNEAGKSTALSSLNQLLYGIDERTPYGFQHGPSRLRISARLQSANGQTLDITRVKARKHPLLDGAGRPIGEQELAPFLAGVTKETFTAEFALGSEELRKGGELLASGKGDLNEALAATRSSLHLNTALATITKRQGELYLRTGKLPKINAGIATLREYSTKISDASLKPEAYNAAQRAVEDAEAEFARSDAELRTARAEHASLTRLQQALPALEGTQQLEVEIAAIQAEGIVAPKDVSGLLPGLRGAHREANGRLADHGKRLTAVGHDLDTLKVDERLLQHGDAIDELVKDRAAVQEAVKRQGQSADEVTRARATAERLLHEVHPQSSLADAALLQVSTRTKTRAKKLHERYTTSTTMLEQAQESVKTRQRRKEQADKDLSQLPPIEDASLLRGAHGAVPRDLLTILASAEDTRGKIRNRYNRLLAELKLGDLAPDAVAVLTVPTREQADELAAKADELKQDRRDLIKEQRKLNGIRIERRMDLERILADAPPTPTELDEARKRRDSLLSPLAEEAAIIAAVAETDRLADLMIRHSTQVAERVRLEADLAKLDVQLHDSNSQLDDLGRADAALARDWTTLWESYPAKAPTISTASRLFDQVGQLRAAAVDLHDADMSLDRQRKQAEEHVARLRTLLHAPDADTMLRFGGATVLSELPELMEIAQARLAEHDQIVQERAVHEARAKSETAELEEVAALLTRQEKDLADLTAEWEQFLQQANLPANRETEAALNDLDRLAEAAEHLEKANAAELKAHQDELRITAFQALLQATANACDFELPYDPAEWHRAVDPLHKELTRHRAAADRREQLITDQSALTVEVSDARAELDRVNGSLSDLVARTRVADQADLEPAADRSVRLEAASDQLRAVSATLPKGAAREALIQQAQSTSPDQLETKLGELGDRLIELETQQTEWAQELAGRRSQLQGLDGSAEAARAGAEAAMITSDLVGDTEQYLRLELARRYILTCMEEYRNSDQDPVLARAATTFRTLTGDRYVSLELSDEDKPAILTKRQDGTLRSTDQLSEGTRDQLYLALRLASLERHADTGRALPVAVDDIFMTFDDQRTAAGLHVLNDLADRFQVIVFTHHEHVAELAVAELPTDRVHLHRLPA
ncbi:AAA family ATPase [Actinomadura scrupuli]|uniref:ATP-binding protein n=1 Tax=Actinomadura scrupuli TaxID=559629 RepID=UPI003D99B084